VGRSLAIRRSEPYSDPGFFILSALLPLALIGSRLMAGSKSGLPGRRKRPSGRLVIVCAIEYARVDLVSSVMGLFSKVPHPPGSSPKVMKRELTPVISLKNGHVRSSIWSMIASGKRSRTAGMGRHKTAHLSTGRAGYHIHHRADHRHTAHSRCIGLRRGTTQLNQHVLRSLTKHEEAVSVKSGGLREAELPRRPLPPAP
jgi:hypothetical protein